MKPALVISGSATGLGVIRALGVHGVPVIAACYDASDFAHFSRFVRQTLRVPHPEHDEKGFLDCLRDHAAGRGGSVLIPCSDPALASVSRHKALLEPGYRVACPEWQIIQPLLEKKNTDELARRAGVPVPRTVFLTSLADLELARDTIEFPWLIKPSSSHQYHDHFRVKMKLVRDFETAVSAYREAADCGLEMMIQEFIPGGDCLGVNYNSYFWDGQAVAEFTARKVRNAPPWLGSPRVVVSAAVPEVLELGRRILKAAKFYGYSCTEFKLDPRDGIFKLMEVNGRHNLSTALAVRCGINFPWLHYHHLVAGRLPVGVPFEQNVYWIELLRDMGHSIRFFPVERYSLAEYLRPYFRRHVFAVLDPADPKPFLGRCARLLQKAGRTLLARLTLRDRRASRRAGKTAAAFQASRAKAVAGTVASHATPGGKDAM